MPAKTSSFRVALFGMDNDRCETVMTVSADTQNKEIRLLTVEDNRGKICRTCENGGPTLALAALSVMLNLKIEHYAAINFGDLGKLFDVIGEISIGPRLLDKAQAVSCMRDSKQRTALLKAMCQKAVSLPPYRYPKLVKECFALCQTDLTVGDVTALLPLAAKRPKIFWENEL